MSDACVFFTITEHREHPEEADGSEHIGHHQSDNELRKLLNIDSQTWHITHVYQLNFGTSVNV